MKDRARSSPKYVYRVRVFDPHGFRIFDAMGSVFGSEAKARKMMNASIKQGLPARMERVRVL